MGAFTERKAKKREESSVLKEGRGLVDRYRRDRRSRSTCYPLPSNQAAFLSMGCLTSKQGTRMPYQTLTRHPSVLSLVLSLVPLLISFLRWNKVLTACRLPASSPLRHADFLFLPGAQGIIVGEEHLVNVDSRLVKESTSFLQVYPFTGLYSFYLLACAQG
jgi:hypothetical protein